MSLTIGLGIATLAVAGYVAVLETRRSLREGTADVRLVDYEVYENANAPGGRQVKLKFFNRGPSDAHGLVPWLQPATYPAPPPYETNRASALLAGDGTSRPHDLPAEYASGSLNIWVT
jgi:hypothetical protein